MEKDFYKKEEISQIGRETTIQEDTKQIDNSSISASPHSDKHYPDKHQSDEHQSDEHWAQISNHIRKEIGDTAWRNWIKPLHFAGVESEIIQLETTSRLLRDRVSSHYSDKLRIIAKTLSLPISGFEIEWNEKSLIMDANAAHTSNPPRITKMQESVRNNPALSPTHGLDPRFTFSNFIVGKPNELAFAAARRVVESATAAFNPLFLYSGVGLGKTHLMHAIAWEVNARQPSRKVMYLSAEKFMYRFIQALRHHDTMTFKEQFRSVDVLMIDDVQFISGKESTQEEFFHTFNALVDEGKQVVLSADKSPTDLSGMEERLRSRLGWGMVADIHATTYELRLGILISKRDSVVVNVPDAVLEFLAHKITSNIRELEGAFNRIVAHASLVGTTITVEMARETLADLIRASSRRVTVDDIQKQVSKHFSIRTSDMFSARRARSIARPRQIAMYLAKNLTTSSYPEIGRKFGGRDHTTIMHAVKKIEELLIHDSELSDDVELLRSLLSDN